MNKAIIKSRTTNIAIILLMAIFFIADRCLKALALGQPSGTSLNLIGHFLSFQFTPNRYLAFSLPLAGWPITALILIIIGFLSYYIIHLLLGPKDQKLTILILTIILFGAISNILDRLFLGYVIDYLYLKYFTVFNLADVMISVGTVSFFISCFNKQKYV